MTILVTGGAGFIGSHLVDALLKQGHHVRVLDALVSQVHGGGRSRYLPSPVELIHGDICDPRTVRKALFPTSVYAITKQDQEQLSLVLGRAYGIPTVALRYFNVYGDRQELSNPYTGVCAIFSARLLNDQHPLVFEDGEQTRDFTHVSDIVQANLLALESDRTDFLALNIGTGVATSVLQIARLLANGLTKN